jgi:hypothetical protein
LISLTGWSRRPIRRKNRARARGDVGLLPIRNVAHPQFRLPRPRYRYRRGGGGRDRGALLSYTGGSRNTGMSPGNECDRWQAAEPGVTATPPVLIPGAGHVGRRTRIAVLERLVLKTRSWSAMADRMHRKRVRGSE